MIEFKDYNEFKNTFFIEDHDRNERQQAINEAKQEHEKIKNEIQQAKLELARLKEERQRENQRERLRLMQAREKRTAEQVKQRQEEQERRTRAEDRTYLTSMVITFLSIISTVVLFLSVLFKY